MLEYVPIVLSLERCFLLENRYLFSQRRRLLRLYVGIDFHVLRAESYARVL